MEDEVPKLFLKSFMGAMDPHTDYFDADEDEFIERLEASFAGIGVQIRPCPLGAQIEDIIKGGPCERSGKFARGDQIVAVDDFTLVGLPINKIVKRIKGKIGTDVKINLLKRESKIIESILLKRDKIKLAEIRVKGRKFETAAGVVGLVSVQTFYKDVHSDVSEKIKELGGEKLAGVVLDLRFNYGGYLEEAVSLTGLFIKSGVVVGERDGSDRIEWKKDTNPDADYLGPLVVLVNQFSASASEIVAGTLKDYGRAVIVGPTQTFGKGTVQRVFPLSILNLPGEIKITTQQYFLAGGSSVQLEGVKPDIIIPGSKLLEDEGMLERTYENAIPFSKIKGELNLDQPEVQSWLEWKVTNLTTLQDKSKIRVAANVEFQDNFNPKKKKTEEPAVARNSDEPPPLVDIKKDEKDTQADEAAAIAQNIAATWPQAIMSVTKKN
ncbi:MAG: S41 family peptidase [Planctomycetota bacterium]